MSYCCSSNLLRHENVFTNDTKAVFGIMIIASIDKEWL